MGSSTTVRSRIEEIQLVIETDVMREVGGVSEGLLQRHFLEKRDREDL